MQSIFLPLKAVCERARIHRNTWRDWSDKDSPRFDPSLPKGVKLGKRTTYYLESEFEAWLQAKIDARESN